MNQMQQPTTTAVPQRRPQVIQVRVITRLGEVLLAAPSAADHRAIILYCADYDRPKLAVGDSVTLQLGDGLQVDAVVEHRSDQSSSTRYECLFDDRPDLVARAVHTLSALFNWRSDYCVPPDPHVRIAARMHTPKGEVQVLTSLLDISVSGCAILLSQDVERLCVDLDRVWISIPIPPVHKTLRMEAVIRYRKLERGQVRYGLEFDSSNTSRFDQKQDVLMAYVMQIQRRLLRLVRRQRKSRSDDDV